MSAPRPAAPRSLRPISSFRWPAHQGALRRLARAIEAHGAPVYLVGGALRDHLLGRHCQDLDFIYEGEPADLVRALRAAKLKPQLGKRTPVLRVALWSGSGPVTVEFMPLRGTLTEHLSGADARVNAMAARVTLRGGLPRLGPLKDPHGGAACLARGELGALPLAPDVARPAWRAESLTHGDEPAQVAQAWAAEGALRAARALRQSAELNLRLAPGALMPEALAAELGRSSPLEWPLSWPQLGEELRRAAVAAPPERLARDLVESGLIEVLLPQLTAARGDWRSYEAPDRGLTFALSVSDLPPREDSWTLALGEALCSGLPGLRRRQQLALLADLTRLAQDGEALSGAAAGPAELPASAASALLPADLRRPLRSFSGQPPEHRAAAAEALRLQIGTRAPALRAAWAEFFEIDPPLAWVSASPEVRLQRAAQLRRVWRRARVHAVAGASGEPVSSVELLLSLLASGEKAV